MITIERFKKYNVRIKLRTEINGQEATIKPLVKETLDGHECVLMAGWLFTEDDGAIYVNEFAMVPEDIETGKIFFLVDVSWVASGDLEILSEVTKPTLANAYEEAEEPILGTMTLLNKSGDISISWSEKNKEKVLAVIRKKMEEGYAFFTTKEYAFKTLKRRIKITNKNIGGIDNVCIKDDEFDKMVVGMDDADVAQLVSQQAVTLGKRDTKTPIDTIKRVQKAEEVINKHSVAVRKVVGG